MLRPVAAMRPRSVQPRCLLPAAPNDSAPYPVCHRAGVGHGFYGSLGQTVCPTLKRDVLPSGVLGMSAPDIL